MALAVLSSTDIKHNDLEVFITTDEEAGMSGALESLVMNYNLRYY